MIIAPPLRSPGITRLDTPFRIRYQDLYSDISGTIVYKTPHDITDENQVESLKKEFMKIYIL